MYFVCTLVYIIIAPIMSYDIMNYERFIYGDGCTYMYITRQPTTYEHTFLPCDYRNLHKSVYYVRAVPCHVHTLPGDYISVTTQSVVDSYPSRGDPH